MRDALLEHLRCPACQSERSFALSISHHDSCEVRDGTLTCSTCEGRFPVREGVVELLGDLPEQIAREAAGLARFAEVMRDDGWDRERIRNLPYEDLPYWWGQRRAFEYWAEQLPFAPGEWLLDVGSSTCWASALFAERGLSVIALDITTAELQGLRTADYFISDGSLFFERLLSSMNEPAIASGSIDYVFCCEALHHNAPAELRRTLGEFHRILRPGGSLMLVNEPLRFPLKLKLDHGSEVAEFEGNEHVYFLHQYLLAARRAGFDVQIRWPRNIPRPTREEPAPEPRAPAGGVIRRELARLRLVQRARVAWRLAVSGDASLNLLCRKPG